jgi:recombination protein RecT
VIVARDCESGGIEVVLTERAAKLRFMAGAYVFPGGTLHASDAVGPLLGQVRVDARSWAKGDALRDRTHALAAVRETFEESGVLLGADALASTKLRSLRERLLAGAEFGELLAAEDISLDLSVLVPLMQWITPTSEPMRFDARFYVARMPASQEASADSRENVRLIWLTPEAALAQARAGSLPLSPPTQRTLELIANESSVDTLVSHALALGTPSVQPILRINAEGVREILYPGDPDHPMSRPVFGGPTRGVF